MKRTFLITDYTDTPEIISIVNEIGELPLKKGSHGFLEVGPIKIGDAAKKSTKNYYKRSRTRPAISLIDIVLAANRKYNKVVAPNISRIEKTDLNTVQDLKDFLYSKTKEEFFAFWGHTDDKKYNTL